MAFDLSSLFSQQSPYVAYIVLFLVLVGGPIVTYKTLKCQTLLEIRSRSRERWMDELRSQVSIYIQKATDCQSILQEFEQTNNIELKIKHDIAAGERIVALTKIELLLDHSKPEYEDFIRRLKLMQYPATTKEDEEKFRMNVKSVTDDCRTFLEQAWQKVRSGQ